MADSQKLYLFPVVQCGCFSLNPPEVKPHKCHVSKSAHPQPHTWGVVEMWLCKRRRRQTVGRRMEEVWRLFRPRPIVSDLGEILLWFQSQRCSFSEVKSGWKVHERSRKMPRHWEGIPENERMPASRKRGQNYFILGGNILLFSKFVFPSVTLQANRRFGYSEPRSKRSVFIKDVLMTGWVGFPHWGFL